MSYSSKVRRKPNVFQHRSDGTTVIILERRKGGAIPCIIDTKDFDLIKDRRWYADKGSYTFYAKSTYPTPIKMHQLILSGVQLVDHEDENGLNNRRQNLRSANHSLNGLNTTRNRTTGKTSKYLGVYRKNKKYISAITIKGKKKHLGSFTSEEKASDAYQQAKKELI